MISKKAIVGIAAVAGALALVASPAQARTNVDLSIGIGVPLGGYVEPAPVYSYPQPAYVAPQPVYVAPQPVYVAPPAYAPAYGYYGRPHHHRGWGRRDNDRDGVPNRFDRRPNNPYRY